MVVGSEFHRMSGRMTRACRRMCCEIRLQGRAQRAQCCLRWCATSCMTRFVREQGRKGKRFGQRLYGVTEREKRASLVRRPVLLHHLVIDRAELGLEEVPHTPNHGVERERERLQFCQAGAIVCGQGLLLGT